MTLDKGSLVLIDYTAKVKDTDEIFETTREDDAKKYNLHDPSRKYEPRLVCIGEGWVLKGVDESLSNANVGDKLNVEITPDKGFGERDSNKVRMIPLRKLGEKAEEVKVGDMIEMDERTGIIRFIGSGRVQIDFNHRFAGRNLSYDLDIIKKIDEDNDKIMNLIKRRLPVDDGNIEINLNETNLDIRLADSLYMLEGLQIIKKAISNDLFRFVSTLDTVNFIESYKSNNKNKKDGNEQLGLSTEQEIPKK